MAYLHCHSCDWSQDDFYDDNYNPAKYLLTWNKYLVSNDIDKPFSNDALFIKENGNISTREVLAKEYESFAKRIRTMKWITYQQWKDEKEENKRCPKCNSKNLDID